MDDEERRADGIDFASSLLLGHLRLDLFQLFSGYPRDEQKKISAWPGTAGDWAAIMAQDGDFVEVKSKVSTPPRLLADNH